MDLVNAPADVQLVAFEQLVVTNPVVAAVVDRLALLEVPDCFVAAGAVFQTV